MRVEKETVIKVLTTDNQVLNVGDQVALTTTDNKALFGKYIGLTVKGALEFRFYDNEQDFTFRVMPKSIVSIYKADIKLLRGDNE